MKDAVDVKCTDDVWFGIAWTTTGGLRLADVTRGTLLTELLGR